MQQDTIPLTHKLAISVVPDRGTALTTLLRLGNDAATRQEYLDSVLHLLQEWSGCQSVSIQLPGPGGGEETRAESQGPRSRAGFASKAVISISHRHRELGTISLADDREGYTPGPLVELVEAIAPMVGQTLAWFSEEALRHDNRRRGQERKETQEQQLRAERLEMAGKVAGQVAHDLNNLISPLVGYPQLIKRHLPPDHPAVQYCDTQIRIAKQITEINEDLLTLSRRGRLKMQPVDLNYLVGIALGETQQLPDALTLHVEMASGLPMVSGAPSQLLRVIANLVSNAREAMDDHGMLTVRTERVGLTEQSGKYRRVPAGDYVRLTVEDTGNGIPADTLERIFDPFFSTKQSNKKSGAGLGLSIVHAIVDDHKGYIDLVSAPGAGTTFYIYIPVPQNL